jgi:hypothetical protein
VCCFSQGASEWLESESGQELKKKAADSLTEALGDEMTGKLSEAIGGVEFSASSLQALSETQVFRKALGEPRQLTAEADPGALNGVLVSRCRRK